ncbi:MAG: GNAT family N-acetyltransferase [Verrucomicrobiales bacterium]|nr:GNAT family N-acetyltransferase [Verrucomicrobiales bacterium]
MSVPRDPAARVLDRPSFTTARLWLRPLTEDDAEWLWELDQDPEVVRQTSNGLPPTKEEMRGVLLPRFLRRFAEGAQYGFWTAGLVGTVSPVGWFHLKPGRLDPFEMEIGYRLFREQRGRGLATEGSRELIRKGFLEWGLPSIAAHALIGNLASRRVMEKCGLRLVREWVVPADWLPGRSAEERRAVYYRLDREPWLASMPSGGLS